MKILNVSDDENKIAITAITGVEIEDINKTLEEMDEIKGDTVFQLFDASKVAGWRHIYYSSVSALNAVRTGSAVSNHVEIEALLYASGQDQISKAIKIMGVTRNTKDVALLVIARDPKGTAIRLAQYLGEEKCQVLKLDEEKFRNLKETYEISEKAIETLECNRYEALERLVIEKCALMPLLR